MVAIVAWKNALSLFVLAHEISHLFGCQHDDRFGDRLNPLSSNYEFGYFIDHPENSELNTIMA